MSSKLNPDHQLRPNNFCVSPFMERILKIISEKAGNNKNNQVSKSHGLQVLILRYARDVQKIDTHKLYKIKH
jgi:hypothetical protein